MQTGGHRQIKRLEIAGFKSFGGRKTFNFEAGITAIVGPNGSGKSNVADAIRWVLGEQKNRRMRIARSEDIIFYGTKNKPQASLAEVSILLDNTKGNFAVPTSEVEITRQLLRSGESTYKVNGRKTKLSQLDELLTGGGFGIESYTVVGQGMIDQILTATGPERKMLFDEASGIRQYDMKRQAALKNLQSSNENLAQVRSILQELEPASKVLQRQSENSHKASEIRDQLLHGRKTYLAQQFESIKLRDAQLTEEITSAKIHLTSIEQEQNIIHKQIKSVPLSTTTGNTEDLKALELERDNLTQQLLLIQSQHSVLLSRQNVQKPSSPDGKALVHKQKLLEKDLLKLQSDYKDHTNKTQAIEQRVLVINAHLAKLTTQLKDIRSQLTKSQKKEFVNHALGLVQLVRTQLRQTRSRKEIDATMLRLSQMLDLALQDNAAELALELVRTQNLISKSMASREEIVETQTQEVIGLRSIELDIASLQSQLSEIARLQKDTNSETTQVSKEIAKHEKSIAKLQLKLKELNRTIVAQRDALYTHTKDQKDISEYTKQTQLLEKLAGEKTRYELQIDQTTLALNELSNQKAQLEDQMQEWFGKQLRLTEENSAKPVDLSTLEQLNYQLTSIETIDPALIQEAQDAASRVEFLQAQEVDLQIAIDDTHDLVKKLEIDIKKRFEKAFTKINQSFTQYFTKLFSGGTAQLQLTTESDGEYGIEIVVSPAGKRGKSINLLSGGEKALAAVALLAAILTTNPSPFIVLDEVDAALDDANSALFTDVMRELSAHNQLIVITHNHETMQAAGSLFGVTTGEKGDSEVLSLVLHQANELLQT